ncbi:O-acetylhomoserine aminocarboxypropyltransferase/cysteine synthase family protein [Natronobacterium gregoryi]|uniref:O-acetylhomoserine aminocarboxypropyltransferase/cysteine synthase n=2 Tax=Natronobacterium gregoryi TaxID=44930 RepID=L0AHX6_NATGS|nr:O-acetylhomoserine aminocarboxypropyltransferase/cysteine synthase family protein [Natronobacterium gregoryi]AFZ72635.1 OAH/OAS sulfhydrylase [Natronobacterium gregoryi SP2]ELY69077.1 O-acetylhomoserine/O-acetylserine sulfhydrylase [Natronobacterium gregoryi SP2]PLK19109.1 O-acetylhomoserine aminocarboxypropyltransferase/cysteine synthase [Natronobacterium gregoryi SP2]SFI90321.1 O-acetylhomoserine (thiol)-lyase [Natronobacterium gregoryi]
MSGDASDGVDNEPNPSGFGTQSVHGGQSPDPATGAVAPAIHQTTSYAFEDTETAAKRYALEDDGYIYSRIGNPTVRTLEKRLAGLEGGTGAVATGSGMAALDSAVLLLAEAGDNVVVSTDTYGGTTTYFSKTATRRNIEPRFVPTCEYDAYEDAIDDETAFVHVETIGNPSLVTPDFERVAGLAHEHGVPLVVDNTFATPALCRPLEHGADLVWESTTKWLHGSGTTVGGVLVDGGSFPWGEYGYDEIGGENHAYYDVDFSRDFPEAPFAAAVRYRSLRTLGNQQSPFDAWQTLQGLESLPLRVEKHCENAQVVAEYLADHEDVAWVTHPGLADHPTHDNARRYLEDFGGMVAFGLENGFDGGKAVCENVELASFLANVGDAKTLVIHPASTTHGQLSPDEQEEAGVTPDLVRLSVGIEEPEDILADLEQAISAATTGSEKTTRRADEGDSQ